MEVGKMEKFFFILILFIGAAKADVYSVINEDKEEWPMCELGGSYHLSHGSYCDRFFTCQQGQVYIGQCEDGLGYVPYKGCMLLHYVDCSTRPKLQIPKGSGHCPRLNGIYNDPRGCGHFYKCDNGTAVPDTCPTSLMFDDVEKVCRHPTDKEKEECTPPAVLPPLSPGSSSSSSSSSAEASASANVSVNLSGGIGSSDPLAAAKFRCPDPGLYPFGDHARYPYPGNCRFYIMCLRDGGIKVGSCQDGTAYNPLSSNCDLDIKLNQC